MLPCLVCTVIAFAAWLWLPTWASCQHKPRVPAGDSSRDGVAATHSGVELLVPDLSSPTLATAGMPEGSTWEHTLHLSTYLPFKEVEV